jgi:hypothetical protein
MSWKNLHSYLDPVGSICYWPFWIQIRIRILLKCGIRIRIYVEYNGTGTDPQYRTVYSISFWNIYFPSEHDQKLHIIMDSDPQRGLTHTVIKFMFSPVLVKAAEEPILDLSPRINFRSGPGG